MKKILTLIILTVISISCGDWLDCNENPNYPSKVPAELLIPSIEASTVVTLNGTLHNAGGFFAQYWGQAPEANQYNDLDKLDIKAPWFNNPYSELYSGALNDAKMAMIEAKESGKAGDYFVAAIMRVYTMQILVDAMDKAPYSEALQGVDNPNAAWDDGQTIYENLVKEIDDAFSFLEQSVTKNIIAKDFIFDSEIEKWKKFANNVKLKLLMRGSYAVDNSAAIKTLISDPNNFIYEDAAIKVFTDEANKRHPWRETQDALTGNHVGTITIINYLASKNDPRIDSYFNKSKNDDAHAGKIPGLKALIKNNDFSTPEIAPTQPGYLMSASEIYLFLAEAELRFNNNETAAKAYYQEAIKASFKQNGLTEDASTFYGPGGVYEWTGTTLEEKIEQIAMQKWVCLCTKNNWEAWTEMRRLGYPSVFNIPGKDIVSDETAYDEPGKLIIPVDNAQGSQFIERVMYPERAIIRNKNTPAQAKLTDKVWWDKK